MIIQKFSADAATCNQLACKHDEKKLEFFEEMKFKAARPMYYEAQKKKDKSIRVINSITTPFTFFSSFRKKISLTANLFAGRDTCSIL